ncbi:MAG: trehalose-6-phosphate synthase [Gemmataceae bacterium]|nr:trehalose-6-phosphate synthase [Planctomycetia bacterium]MBX3399865.1 trehalose-6-phosphate synthase [Gemmataceae bacterium]
MWNRQSLHDLIQSKLQGHKFIVVANREPFIHQYKDDAIEVVRPASGMASALDPIMDASEGTWIAHGSGGADREVVDEFDRIRVPPEDPKYTLRRIWLTKEQERGFYDGMANDGIYPLCLVTFTPPHFRPSDWEQYKAVNRLYADAVLQETGGDPAFVFIQDYHFGLLPRMLKEANPKLIVAQFWHIPWPNREVFRVFPWKEELIDGLLGNDLLGFHIRYHCQNFLDTIDRMIEARVDTEHFNIERAGHTTLVRPFPIGVDYEELTTVADSPAVKAAMAKWRKRIDRRVEFIGVGIERLDYTKGIPQRLQAIDYLFEHFPEYRRKLAFVQVAVPSRLRVPAYQRLAQEVDSLVEQINFRWRDRGWEPIVYVKEYQGPTDMTALHRLGRFCVISSLHDGMNLVAKEFIASRTDDDGVLILSRFTGSARELPEALLVNPFAVHEIADAMHQAIIMPDAERQRRMKKLREQVEKYNVYRWGGKVLSELLKFEFQE